MTFHPLGDSALTLDFADESSDRERLLARALSAAERLEAANVPGVIDVTCAYESVAVFFDPTRIEQDFEEKIGALVPSAGVRALRKVRKVEFIKRIHRSLCRVRAWISFSRRAIGKVAGATTGKSADESSGWFRRHRECSSWHLSI